MGASQVTVIRAHPSAGCIQICSPSLSRFGVYVTSVPEDV